MSQPLYIAPDEEIISVIARLRSLPEREVTLVFPKHSVVTQSIINLKLLAREGEKLQKNLILVSQNENARVLAEKIGFATLPYTQEMEKPAVVTSQPEEVTPEPPAFTPSEALQTTESDIDTKKPKSFEIGSQGFYSGPSVAKTHAEPRPIGDIAIQKPTPVTPPPTQPLPPNSTSLRVRNATPERPPGLNSVRYAERMNAPDLSRQSTVTPPIFPDTYKPASPEPMFKPSEGPTAIKDFFSRGEASSEPAIRMPKTSQVSAPLPPTFAKKADIPKKVAPVKVDTGVGKKTSVFLLVLIVTFFVALAALLFFLVFPKATVIVNPQSLQESYDQTFTLDTESSNGEIPLQKTTREVTATVAGIASGASTGSNSTEGRAKGTIKITNTYSSDAQPLVSSTRFESPSGKIYRIQQDVTVPGNGSVEATVVADGTGESYNLSEGTLTIPGFKGTDKYAKFNAVTVGSISGGGGTESVSGGSFIRADEETLRSRAQEEAKRIFAEEVDNESGDTYTFTDGLVIERITETNLPKVGTTPGEYEYSAVFKITAFTTSKDTVTKAVSKNIRSEYDGISFSPTSQEVSFADFTVNTNDKKASLKAHLDTTLVANVNEESIKSDLAGKSAADLENFTTSHPEVKGLSIIFRPSWALKRIPNDTDKIELQIEL